MIADRLTTGEIQYIMDVLDVNMRVWYEVPNPRQMNWNNVTEYFRLIWPKYGR